MATQESAEAMDRAPARRGIYEPFNAFHQCWYPVSVATDLGPGGVKSMRFCDSRIVLYRGEDGQVRAMTARCKHMGADLGLGDVVGDNIRCPFHHWEYGPSGACVKIPSGDKIPAGTTQLTFPCEEKWGLIWVFLGREPTYAIPDVPDYDPAKVISRSFELVLPQPLLVEPWAFSTNLFDFAHFKAVHNWTLSDLKRDFQDNHMGWEAQVKGVGFMRQDLYGVASVVSYVQANSATLPKQHMAGLCPRGSDGLGIFFTLFATLADDSAEAHADAVRRLDENEALHRRLPNEDLPILNSVEFGPVRLTEVDQELATFLKYVSRYPTTTIKELEGAR